MAHYPGNMPTFCLSIPQVSVVCYLCFFLTQAVHVPSDNPKNCVHYFSCVCTPYTMATTGARYDILFIHTSHTQTFHPVHRVRHTVGHTHISHTNISSSSSSPAHCWSHTHLTHKHFIQFIQSGCPLPTAWAFRPAFTSLALGEGVTTVETTCVISIWIGEWTRRQRTFPRLPSSPLRLAVL